MQLFHFECFHIALFRNQQSVKDPQPPPPAPAGPPRPPLLTEQAPALEWERPRCPKPRELSGSARSASSTWHPSPQDGFTLNPGARH